LFGRVVPFLFFYSPSYVTVLVVRLVCCYTFTFSYALPLSTLPPPTAYHAFVARVRSPRLTRPHTHTTAAHFLLRLPALHTAAPTFPHTVCHGLLRCRFCHPTTPRGSPHYAHGCRADTVRSRATGIHRLHTVCRLLFPVCPQLPYIPMYTVCRYWFYPRFTGYTRCYVGANAYAFHCYPLILVLRSYLPVTDPVACGSHVRYVTHCGCAVHHTTSHTTVYRFVCLLRLYFAAVTVWILVTTFCGAFVYAPVVHLLLHSPLRSRGSRCCRVTYSDGPDPVIPTVTTLPFPARVIRSFLLVRRTRSPTGTTTLFVAFCHGFPLV